MRLCRLYVLISIQLCLFAGSSVLYGQKLKGQVSDSTSQQNGVKGDTIPASGRIILPPDTNITAKDTNEVSRDQIIKQLKADSDLDSPVSYKAEDSIVFDINDKMLFLYDKGKINYEDIELEADAVSVNWETETLYATGVDSSGIVVGKPKFKEGEQHYFADTIAYNFNTGKGKIKLGRTTQDGEQLIGENIKKVPDPFLGKDVYYIRNGKFTTCIEPVPHYHIRSRKLKVIPKDRIISGPLMLVVEEFPIPIVVPFGFFPNNNKRRSGIVFPEWGEAADRGFFLRNGGYYWAISDYMDFLARGDIFSKGGYRLEVSTSYNKRYRYNGTFGVEYGLIKFGEKTDPTYNQTNNFFIRWNHDQKISPSATLRANVNAGSSNYLSAMSYNTQEYLTNTLKSTVNFSKNFTGTPWAMNLNLGHDQNTNTKLVNLTLPNLTVTRGRTQPLKKRGGIARNDWLSRIGYSYTGQFMNKISAPDSVILDVLFNPGMDIVLPTTEGGTTVTPAANYYRNGIKHSIPVSTSIQLFNYLTISPSFNYSEWWYFRTLEKALVDGVIESENVKGFSTARSFNFTTSATTKVYGVYQYGGKRRAAIRHTVTPTLSYRYNPDFSLPSWGFYNSYLTRQDSLIQTAKYSRFEQGVLGGPGSGEQQTINFGLQNLWEMKILPKDYVADTATTQKDPFKRFNLIDNLSVNSGYNFAADSLKLDVFRFNLRTKLLNMFTINMNATLEPYDYDTETGKRLDRYYWASQGKPGWISNFDFSFDTRFQSSKRQTAPGPTTGRIEPEVYDDLQRYRDLYVDFNIPWTLNLSYKLTYYNTGISSDTIQSVGFSGDVNLTSKWKVGFNSGYDFANKDFSYTSISIYRDLHCWEMSFHWIPFGQRKSYTFSLNVKSATLQDLKLTKRKDWQDRFVSP